MEVEEGNDVRGARSELIRRRRSRREETSLRWAEREVSVEARSAYRFASAGWAAAWVAECRSHVLGRAAIMSSDAKW